MREKARAVAATLAEQDQETLRGMSVEQLKALQGAALAARQHPAEIDGVTYTVTSEAKFVTDDTDGTPACGFSSKQTEYFRITSTVASNVVGKRIPTVKIDSLVAPSVEYSQKNGTLGVKVIDSKGQPVAGLAVDPSGALGTQTTDANGCVMWRSIPIGPYTVTVNRPGWGAEDGSNPLVREQTVSPNTVSFVNLTYDHLGSAKVLVNTHIPGTTPTGTNVKPSIARTLSATGASSTDRTWPNPTSANPVVAESLFPFATTEYSFYTGACSYQSPAHVVHSNYFTNTNSAGELLVAPGVDYDQTTVFQPPVNIRVTRTYNRDSAPANGAVQFRLTPIKPASAGDEECVDTPQYTFVSATWPNSGWGTANRNQLGWASRSATTFDPGLPFGEYSLCLVDTTRSSRQYHNAGTYDNRSVNGAGASILNPANNRWSSTPC
jgi:hypothetical protein